MVAVGGHRGDGGAPQGGLDIETSRSDGWAVVAFAGELDLAEAPGAERALSDALGGGDGLVADLRGVTFLGSTGIRVLLEAQASAAEVGAGFRVVQGDGAARRLIDLLGLSERLAVVDDD